MIDFRSFVGGGLMFDGLGGDYSCSNIDVSLVSVRVAFLENKVSLGVQGVKIIESVRNFIHSNWAGSSQV